MKSAVLVVLLAVAVAPLQLLGAGTIEVVQMNTYDAGARRLNGQWRIASDVKMTYLNSWGNEDTTSWRTQHWINATTGQVLVGTGWQEFTNSKFWSTIDAYAAYDTCYQGKATAIGGGVTRDIGGNHVCTDPGPYGPDWCDVHPAAEECGFDSTCPILVNLTNGPWLLSGQADPVRFDLDADGTAENVTWTDRSSSLAFVAYDRNRNGVIDDGSELFGNSTPSRSGTAKHGFAALLALDENGDSAIDAADSAWPLLLLWSDRNHDGVSQPHELVRVTATELVTLDLRFHWTARSDQHGNSLRYEAVARFARGARPYYDVYFVRVP